MILTAHLKQPLIIKSSQGGIKRGMESKNKELTPDALQIVRRGFRIAGWEKMGGENH
jgi:hypothetical protein